MTTLEEGEEEAQETVTIILDKSEEDILSVENVIETCDISCSHSHRAVNQL